MENEVNVNVHVKKKKEIIKPVADTISIESIFDKGNLLTNPEYRCLYYIIYLTGARVSEAIEYLRVNDIEYKTHITEENNKSVVRKVGVFNVVTLKRRDKPKRKIPILYSDSRSAEAFKIENAMIEYIKLFTNKMLMEEKIFRCKRDSATNYFKKHIQFKVDATYKGKRISIDYKMHCHYLRHCRVTHMRETHGFDILDLKQFTGWTSTAMTDRYLHAGWKSLMEKMIKNG